MIDAGNSLNGSKTQTIKVHFDAELFDFWRIAYLGVGIEELTTAVLADEGLLTGAMTVLADTVRITSRAFHSSIMQRLIFRLLIRQRTIAIGPFVNLTIKTHFLQHPFRILATIGTKQVGGQKPCMTIKIFALSLTFRD